MDFSLPGVKTPANLHKSVKNGSSVGGLLFLLKRLTFFQTTQFRLLSLSVRYIKEVGTQGQVKRSPRNHGGEIAG